jgi:hypothetical protein
MALRSTFALALAVAAQLVFGQGTGSLQVSDISVPQLMSLSTGAQLEVAINGHTESFLVTQARRSATGGEIEGHLITDDSRQMHIDWEGASIRGLFQSADGAILALGAGDGQSKPFVEVAAPAALPPTEPLGLDQFFTGPSAYAFHATIAALSAPIGQVVNDRAVAYQARCGNSATLRDIRDFVQSPLGATAISIVTSENAQTDYCRNTAGPPCVVTAAHRVDYLATIADITCTHP